MKKIILLSLIFTFLCFAIEYDNEKRRYHFFTTDEGIAINYMDPVSYWDGNPKEGLDKLFFVNNAVAFAFSSEANKGRYIDKMYYFEPQYGGWCAWNMSQKRSKIEPDLMTYRIISDKLYLFESEENAQKFEKSYQNLSIEADKNWEEVYNIPVNKDDYFIRNQIY